MAIIRISVLLVLFGVGRVQAQTGEVSSVGNLFATDRLVSLYTESLTFITPRILNAVPVSQLTLWGLQGLTALDPEITTVQKDGHLQMSRQDKMLLDLMAPNDEAPATWARIAVLMTSAGYAASPAVHRAGAQGIVQGFFDELFSHIDPYSRYVPPTEAGEDRTRRAGRAGLGLTIGQRGRLMTVRAVVRDSPGAIAGIQPGAILLAVDGQRTKSRDARTIGALMAGPEGSAVTLCWRGRDGRTRDARLIRITVPSETVFAERHADMLVLRITSFSMSTASHIALSVRDMLAEPHPVAGIVLDLRDNRGGLLRQAVTAADSFLPAGVIATTTGRDADASHIWRSAEGELAENVPLVVLVNGRTASSAEVLAAALSDRGRAVVVGSATLGKGLVQTIDPLPDGGELLVTWSRVTAPLGWPLQALGVLPQVCTSLGWEALNRQLAALSAGLQPMAPAIKAERAARAPVAPLEALTLRAPCPAAEGRPADLVAAQALIADPVAYAAALLPPMLDR
ncbi:S41 family peptidase [Rhodopila sp.]|uniref:S41 family peptidase n=1 Tax=Rhodopila sp. TaxID=2480087 RepID=UPI003D0CB99B